MPHDPAEATRIAALNKRARATWLVETRQGQHSLNDTLTMAVRPEHSALLKLRVDDLVCALYPDMTSRARDVFVAKLRQYTSCPASYGDRKLTLGWLLKNNERNPGALAHRIAALYDALDTSGTRRAKRVYGFPFTMPDDLSAVWSAPRDVS